VTLVIRHCQKSFEVLTLSRAVSCRERNRILARRTRLRKKVVFEVRFIIIIITIIGAVSNDISEKVFACDCGGHSRTIDALPPLPCVPPSPRHQSLQKQVNDLKRENTSLKDKLKKVQRPSRDAAADHHHNHNHAGMASAPKASPRR
jgi:hypothetical protein